MLCPRREEIQDAAPAGDGAGFLHQWGDLVAKVRRPAEEVLDIQLVAGLEGTGVGREVSWIHHQVNQPMDGGHHDLAGAITAVETIQERDPLSRHREVKGKLLVREGFRSGPQGHLDPGREKLCDGVAERLSAVSSGGDDQRRVLPP